MSLWIITARRNREIPSDLKSRHRNTARVIYFPPSFTSDRQRNRKWGCHLLRLYTFRHFVAVRDYCSAVQSEVLSSAIFRRKLIPSGMCYLFTPGIARFYSGCMCTATCEEAIESSAYVRNREPSQSAAMRMRISGSALFEWIFEGKNWIARAPQKGMNVKDTKKLDKRKLSGKRFRNGIPLGMLKRTGHWKRDRRNWNGV